MVVAAGAFALGMVTAPIALFATGHQTAVCQVYETLMGRPVIVAHASENLAMEVCIAEA
jgi:hypothetical protein